MCANAFGVRAAAMGNERVPLEIYASALARVADQVAGFYGLRPCLFDAVGIWLRPLKISGIEMSIGRVSSIENSRTVVLIFIGCEICQAYCK